MISTITTSTISTITLAGSLSIIGASILLFLLVQRELFRSSQSIRTMRTGRILRIGIIPLVVAFILIVFSRAADVMLR